MPGLVIRQKFIDWITPNCICTHPNQHPNFCYPISSYQRSSPPTPTLAILATSPLGPFTTTSTHPQPTNPSPLFAQPLARLIPLVTSNPQHQLPAACSKAPSCHRHKFELNTRSPPVIILSGEPASNINPLPTTWPAIAYKFGSNHHRCDGDFGHKLTGFMVIRRPE